MRAWLILLGGMLVWTVHFFSLYAFASIWGSGATARVLTGLATLLCLGASAAVFLVAMRTIAGRGPDRILHWPARVGLLGAGLSFVAVLWQGLPALVG